MSKVLIISKAELSEEQQQYESKHLSSEGVTRVSSNIDEELKKLSSSSFDEVKLFWDLPSENVLGQVLRVLKPKGKFLIDGAIPDRAIGQTLSTDVSLFGFVDPMVAKDSTTQFRFLICQKPDWEIGDSKTLNISNNNAEKSSWKLGLGDLADNDIVDENDLLNEEKVEVKGEACGVDDNQGSKKRSCKNCTCGLAEEEAKEAATVKETAPRSGCGNCGKGDAFRCAGCPYLGQPAFDTTTGTKLVLALGSDE